MRKKNSKYNVNLFYVFIIILASLFIFSVSVPALILTYFNNSLSSENLSFTGNQNITRYLDLPMSSNITSANMTIKNINTTTLWLEIGTKDGTYEFNDSGTLNATPINQSAFFINSSFIGTLYGTVSLFNDSNLSTFFGLNNTIYASFFNISFQLGNFTTSPYIWGIMGECYDQCSFDVYPSCVNWTTGNFYVIDSSGSRWGAGAVYRTYPLPTSCVSQTGLVTTRFVIFTGTGKNATFNETQIQYNSTNFNTSIYVINNLSQTINTALNNSFCSCVGCIINNAFCSIPLTFHSDTSGVFSYADINITYFTLPNVTLISPINNSAVSVSKIFNCSITDNTTLVNSTFYLWNSTKNLINTTIISLAGQSNSSIYNITFNYSDTYQWSCLAYNNESHSSFALNNFTIVVDVSNPATNMNFPTNNQYLNYNINVDFNCTTDGTNLDAGFLYGNFTGSFIRNQTFNLISPLVKYSFKNNFTDGDYLWSCGANKTLTSTITLSQLGNFTLHLDTIFPNITISLTTTAGSQTITFNSTETDKNINTCKYSIYNASNGIDGLNSNISFSCNSNNTQATVSAFNTYNLTIYAIDLAGNENSSTLTFTTSASSGGTVSSGGGGSQTENSIPVIGLLSINSTKQYTPLYREAIYSSINSQCSIKLRTEALAITDYSSECNLNVNDLIIVKQDLEKLGVEVSLDDLKLFYLNYKKNLVFQGQENQKTIDAYNLFTSILGLTSLLQLNPPSIRSPVIIINPSGGNYTITDTILSNKPIQTCESVNNPKLSCFISNSTLKIYFFLDKTDYLSQVISGNLNIITLESSNKVEQRKYPVTYTVYNLGYQPIKGLSIYIILLVFLVFLIGCVFILYKRRKRIKIPKQINEVKDLFSP